MALINDLERMKGYYDSGATRSYEFRKEQLEKFKKVLLKYEKEIYEALYSDLKKSREEAYASELGLLLGEIKFILKNLKEWMRPRRVTTELVNFPASSKIYRDPLGVVLIIAPWNYPLQLLLIPFVGAIAGGNCVVLKPSEFSEATGSIITRMIAETFSPEYVIVVNGDGAMVVPEMMNAFRFDHVFYTGSIPVGKAVYKMAAEKLVPVTLELGGKSPAVVEADAHLVSAARRIVMGCFLNTGQTCIGVDYLLVHHSIKDKFLEKIKATISKFYSADPSSVTDYGKIINEKRFDKLVSYLEHGHIIAGGKHDRSKLYIEPTIMDNITMDLPLMKEEIFGPVLPVITFDTTEEAMQIVLQNPNPLAFYLFTGNKKKQKEWIERIHFGGGSINETAWYFANKSFPFGGVGNSGIGSYHGKYSFDTFTREKPVLKSPTWFDPDFKYPPLKGKLKLFKWFIR
jgi:aldehyde dehydrogenase (NAD+)